MNKIYDILFIIKKKCLFVIFILLSFSLWSQSSKDFPLAKVVILKTEMSKKEAFESMLSYLETKNYGILRADLQSLRFVTGRKPIEYFDFYITGQIKTNSEGVTEIHLMGICLLGAFGDEKEIQAANKGHGKMNIRRLG